MSNPLAAINKGEAIQIDSPPPLFGRPANQATAIFIGIPAMNASSATLVHDRAPQLVLVDCRKPIDARRAGAVSGTDRIEVGIRPQAIGLQARPNDTFLFHPDSNRTLCCGICGESG